MVEPLFYSLFEAHFFNKFLSLKIKDEETRMMIFKNRQSQDFLAHFLLKINEDDNYMTHHCSAYSSIHSN